MKNTDLLKKMIKEEMSNILKEDDFYANKKILDTTITEELISALEYFSKYYSTTSFKKTKEFSGALRVLKYIKTNINRYQKIQ